MSIYSEYKLGYLTDDEFEQAVRDEAWLDSIHDGGEPCEEDYEDEEDDR